MVPTKGMDSIGLDFANRENHRRPCRHAHPRRRSHCLNDSYVGSRRLCNILNVVVAVERDHVTARELRIGRADRSKPQRRGKRRAVARNP